MSTGEPQPKSEAILGRRQNRLSTVLVGFEMYNFWDPMFIVSLENANFRPILDNLGENDEGAIEGVLVCLKPFLSSHPCSRLRLIPLSVICEF